MAGRAQAVTAAVGFAVLAMFLPPVALLSGAAVALVTLRQGLFAGTIVAVLGAVALALMGMISTGQPGAGLVFALGQWLLPLLFAELLRQTVSWRLTLQVLMGLALLLVVGVNLLWPESTAMWRAVLEEGLAPAMLESGVPQGEIDEALDSLAGLVNAVIGVAVIVTTVVTLIIARYWQAALYNPGGFGEEFRALRLGYLPAFVALGLVPAAALTEGPLFGQLALVALSIFLFQGLALIHGLARVLKWHVGWLVALYVLLAVPLFTAYTVAMVTALGVIDSFADFRSRMRNLPRDDE